MLHVYHELNMHAQSKFSWHVNDVSKVKSCYVFHLWTMQIHNFRSSLDLFSVSAPVTRIAALQCRFIYLLIGPQQPFPCNPTNTHLDNVYIFQLFLLFGNYKYRMHDNDTNTHKSSVALVMTVSFMPVYFSLQCLHNHDIVTTRYLHIFIWVSHTTKYLKHWLGIMDWSSARENCKEFCKSCISFEESTNQTLWLLLFSLNIFWRNTPAYMAIDGSMLNASNTVLL